MNTNQINKKSTNKDNLQKKSNLRALIFTFLGTFIVFFFAFTVLLPILTPQVDIPALTDEHSMSSVTSNDFKGRIDPRLSTIEQQEETAPPKLKMEIPNKDTQSQDGQININNQNTDANSVTDQIQEPKDSISDEDSSYNYNIDNKTPDNAAKPIVKTAKPVSIANIPPRPQMPAQYAEESEKPITMTKVILGSYATPIQARLIADTLIEMDLNVAPLIKEKNGRYMLQVGSFADPAKAEGLAQELKSKSFDAKVVYE